MPHSTGLFFHLENYEVIYILYVQWVERCSTKVWLLIVGAWYFYRTVLSTQICWDCCILTRNYLIKIVLIHSSKGLGSLWPILSTRKFCRQSSFRLYWEHSSPTENIFTSFLCKKKQKRKLLAMDRFFFKYPMGSYPILNSQFIMLFHQFPSSKNIYFSLKHFCRWSGNCSFFKRCPLKLTRFLWLID